MSRSRINLAFFLARGFLGVGIVLGVIGTVAAVATAASDDPASRVVDLDRSGRIPNDVEGASLAWAGDASITILDPSASLVVANAVPAVLLGLAVAVASWLLLIVVVDVQRGVPFEVKAARRLLTCAAIVTVAALAHPLLSAWADVAVLDAADRGGRDFGFYAYQGLADTGPWLLVAALLAAFAHAFGEGRRLADDTEGLV